jgi:hypothetical protein
MPKQRPSFDRQRYESLKVQGLSQRAIAEQMGMPEATLRENLKVLAQVKVEDLLGDNQGPPHGERPKVSQEGPPEGDPLGTPPLYVHPGIPGYGEDSSIDGEDSAEVHPGIPALPLTGIQEGDQGPPVGELSPQLAEALTAAWPELQHMLDWWRARQQHLQEPLEKLERVTYHVAPKWIEAVKREADVTGESYAAVVNRAFASYFRGKSTST